MNELQDALRRTAEEAPLRSADLGVVRARARSIRRRRASVAVGGSVAAIAVIAGLGVALAPGGTDHAVPPVTSNSALPTPSETSSTTPTASPDDGLPQFPTGTVFHVSTTVTDVGQTDGSAERVPYWRDGALVAPDGSRTPLKDRPDAVALDTQGDWWLITGGDTSELEQLSPDGRPLDPPVESVPHGLLAAPGREATITKGPHGWVLTTNDRAIDLSGVTANARVDGFLANGDVVYTPDGIHERVAHVPTGSTAAAPGMSWFRSSPAGDDAVLRDDGTWTVEGPNGATAWTLGWASVGGLSDDGRYVALVGDPNGLVPGSEEWDEPDATGTLWIRDTADGSPVSVFTAPSDGFFGPWTWEGDDILALVFERDSSGSRTGTWTLVRLAPDGYKLVRSTSWPGRIDAPPYVFGAGVTPAP